MRASVCDAGRGCGLRAEGACEGAQGGVGCLQPGREMKMSRPWAPVRFVLTGAREKLGWETGRKERGGSRERVEKGVWRVCVCVCVCVS